MQAQVKVALIIGGAIIAYGLIQGFATYRKTLLVEELRKSEELRNEHLLEVCLSGVKEENSKFVKDMLDWAQKENKDGKYDLTNAFEDMEKQYQIERKECFAMYPK